MSKKLQDIAKSLSTTPVDLFRMIPELDLSFKVRDLNMVLTADQEEELVSAVEATRPKTEVSRKPGVRRRAPAGRSKGEDQPAVEAPSVPAASSVPEPAPAASDAASPEVPPEPIASEAAPAARRRSFATVVTRSTPVVAEPPPPAPTPSAVEPTVAPPPADEPESPAPSPAIRRRPGIATVVTRPAVEKAVAEEPVAAASDLSVEPAPPVASEAPAAPAGPQRRFATVVTQNTRHVRESQPIPQAPEPVVEVEEPAEPARPTSRFATVHTRPQGERVVPPTAAAAMTPMERADQMRREIDAREGSRGAARIVGTVNLDTLRERLEGDRRDFGRPAGAPGAPRPATPAEDAEARKNKKGKPGKRVVQSREIYDSSKGRGATSAMGRKGGKKGADPRSLAPMRAETEMSEHKRVVRMGEAIVVADLAHQMGVKAGEVAMKLMFDLGVRGANINTPVDFDTATLLAEIYRYKVEKVGFDITQYLPTVEDSDEELELRPPVVTVMGHVDHGKTSLLDAIRKTGVAATEAGGITQHIGAYMVKTPQGAVTFLDTPGHEAFSALRARGAQATDVVVLVVAADDGVMPQTVEAINHARDAKVPIIVAINKMDKPGANPERIKQALTEFALVPEEWGGETLYVETSAKAGLGVGTLLETIALQAEVLELRANPNRRGEGLVIESRLDVGRGPVATLLVQAGTIRVGDSVVIGRHYGRIRSMTNERGEHLASATPSTPVEITGLSGVPESGERCYAVKEEKDARTIAEHVGAQNKQAELAAKASVAANADNLSDAFKAGLLKELKVIVKGDVQGSVEAINQSLVRLSTPKVGVRVIHSAVGSITESDVNLAASSREDSTVVIIGFNTRAETRAQNLADNLGVQVHTFTIIYEILDKVQRLMAGLLSPVYTWELLGRAEVRATFSTAKYGMIAGCMIVDGVIQRNAKAKVVRGGEVVVETSIGSLRHFNNDMKEMKQGFECGISLDGYKDVRVGDVIEAYKVVESAATL